MNSRLARLRNRAQRCVELPNTQQLVDTNNPGVHLSCNSGGNGTISKDKLISNGNSVRLSAAMRCAGVLNRSFGGKWKYINETQEPVEEVVEEEVIEEIIETVISTTGLNLVNNGDQDGILPTVLGRVITDTSYNTETVYGYILDTSSPVSYALTAGAVSKDVVLYLDSSSNLILKTQNTRYNNNFLDFIFFDISLNRETEELVLEPDEKENYLLFNLDTYYI